MSVKLPLEIKLRPQRTSQGEIVPVLKVRSTYKSWIPLAMCEPAIQKAALTELCAVGEAGLKQLATNIING